MVLRIRPEQVEGLQADDKLFVGWYVEIIMKNYFAHLYFSLTDEGKKEMVLNGRRCAKAHGLRTAEAQGHFISLMWDIGPNFYLFPGFREILARTDIVEMEKIDMLYSDAITPEQAQTAITGADDSYWYLDCAASGKGLED